MNTFVGIDLGWYGKPSGLASIRFTDGELQVSSIDRMESVNDILAWIQAETGTGNAVAAVDAPLAIQNAAGIRLAERELNADFRRFHAGCHASNLGRPFAQNVIAFRRHLEALDFQHSPVFTARQKGRFQIEVHPHAATVSLFGLDLIVKYKRGKRADRGRELARLKSLMEARLPQLEPPFNLRLPVIPLTGNLKPVEDQIDAVMCAYIAAHWWYWGTARNRVYGGGEDGAIIVPLGPARTKASAPLGL